MYIQYICANMYETIVNSCEVKHVHTIIQAYTHIK